MKNNTVPYSRSALRNKQLKRFYAVIAALVFIILIAAVFRATSSTGNSKKHEKPRLAVVKITSKGFEPATLSVRQGTRITWTNTDNSLHQVVANPYPEGSSLPSLKSSILDNAQTFTYTADSPGTFGYHDQLHPRTNGILIVQKS